MKEVEKELKELMNDIDKLKANLETIIREKDWNLLDMEVLEASRRLNIAITDYNKALEKQIGKTKK